MIKENDDEKKDTSTSNATDGFAHQSTVFDNVNYMGRAVIGWFYSCLIY